MTPAEITVAIQGAAILIKLISQAIEQAKRDGEWTPEEEAAIDAEMETAFKADHWRV